MKVSRDGVGRFQGGLSEYWNDESEVWVDYKERDLTFPIHNQYQSSEVNVSNLKDNK
jgi:hypothetical protein